MRLRIGLAHARALSAPRGPYGRACLAFGAARRCGGDRLPRADQQSCATILSGRWPDTPLSDRGLCLPCWHRPRGGAAHSNPISTFFVPDAHGLRDGPVLANVSALSQPGRNVFNASPPARSMRFTAGRGTIQALGAKVSVTSKRRVKTFASFHSSSFYHYITML